ncbi:MAG: diaminopimelate epimerase [Lachnospirales bacterium]
MKFTKMHGCGNDYVYVNCFEETVENPAEVSKAISDRHFGIGSDGLVLICPPSDPNVADCRMRMFNPDGSEAEMCGNASRCVGRYVYDRNVVKKNPIRLETGAGIKVIEVKLDEKGEASMLTVDMGEPILEPSLVPVTGEASESKVEGFSAVSGLKLASKDKEFDFTCVSMGNPHAVTFIDSKVKDFPVEFYGPSLEVNPVFPRKTNVEFVEFVDETHLNMRVWERGTGETWACGTGTCATVVAANLLGKCPRVPVEVTLLGGKLIIEWNKEDNHVYMTGPATFVFDGVWLG